MKSKRDWTKESVDIDDDEMAVEQMKLKKMWNVKKKHREGDGR